jgi:signal transduction histidine kinase
MTSLRRRLTVGLMLGIASLLGLGGALVFLAARHYLYHEFDAHLRTRVLSMAALAKPARGGAEMELPLQLHPLQEEAQFVAHYQFFDSHGRSLAKSPALQGAELPPRFGSLSVPEIWNLALPDGTPARAMGVQFAARPPLKETKSTATNAVALGLVVAADRTHLDRDLHALVFILLGVGGLSLAASLLMTSLMLRNCMTPLQQLAGQTSAIDASTLATRFPTDHLPAELAPIAHCLNSLLARLHGSFERERRFSADLAHELRTPIAGLRTTAEVALKFHSASDPQPMRDVLEIAGEMEAMVTHLLALARSEQRTLPLQPQSVALAPLLAALWQPLRDKASARRLAVVFEVPEEARLETDPALLRGILSNLLRNAVDYTPVAGQCRVVFTQQGCQFSLVVANAVDNLDLSDLPHLFGRFWRKDKARSDAEHTGLGLSLAKSFAELLGFELTAALQGSSTLALSLQGPLRWTAPSATAAEPS